jgi:gliding motility-associated-like protein
MTEICGNGIDDDGDNLVDCFDPDCCGNSVCTTFYYNPCNEIECPFKGSLNFEMNSRTIGNNLILKTTEYIGTGDLNQDGTPDFVAVDDNNNTVVIDGQSGQVITSIGSQLGFINFAFGDVIPDLPGNEILIGDVDGINCYNLDGNKIWQQNEGNLSFTLSLEIADFNYDGLPEIYVENYILNGQTGEIINILPSQTLNLGDYTIAMPANLFSDAECPRCAGLEYVLGNKVYALDIENKDFEEVSAANSIPEALSGILVDWNLDGTLEVISFDFNNFYLWEPRTGDLINTFSSPVLNRGVPNIGNLDNDPEPEISFVQINEMVAIDNDFNLKWRSPILDASGFTGITLFDFNADGLNEIIYRDEKNLRILSGETGQTITLQPCISATGYEYPIIADIDNDMEADIITVCGVEELATSGVLTVFSSGLGSKWADARPVWNQNRYFNVHINDDLTIPKQMQNLAAVSSDPALNSFLNQYFVVERLETDLSANLRATDPKCQEISFRICNENNATFDEMIPITVYNADPTSAQNAQKIIFNYTPPSPLLSGECAVFSSPIDNDIFWNKELFIIINDAGSLNLPFDLNTDFPNTTFAECDYINNLVTMEVFECPIEMEICDNGIDDDGDGLIDYLDSDCPCSESNWTSGLNYLPYEINCGLTFSLGIALDIDFTYQWYKDGVKIPNGSNTTIFIPTGNDNWIGEYFVEIRSPMGCQQLNTLTLAPTVDSTTEYVDVCPGDKYEYLGQEYEPGSYFINLISQKNECDSIVNLIVEEAIFVSKSEEISICQGDFYLLNGIEIRNAGNYIDTIISDNFCDTILDLTLNIIAPEIYPQELSLCAGDTIRLAGNLITNSATVLDTVSGSVCDSIIQYNVQVIPREIRDSTVVLCHGDSLFFNDIWLKEAGIYNDTLPVNNGCEFVLAMNTIIESIAEPNVSKLYALSPDETSTIFINDNSNQLMYQWLDANGSLLKEGNEIEINPSFAPFIILESLNNCVRYDTIYIQELAAMQVYLPNAISPNQDGINDQMTINGLNMQSIDATIFDRWGSIVHRYNNHNPGTREDLWDGTFNGKINEAGVYTYLIKVISNRGEEQIVSGNVAIIR